MYNSKYYNKEKQTQANKKWREKNSEKYKKKRQVSNKNYQKTHRDKVNAIALNYYYRHKEEVLKKLKEKRTKDKEKI